MMTQERAAYIVKNKLPFGSFKYSFKGPRGSFNAPTYTDGITPEEDGYIRSLWELLPGSYSYADVLFMIANGRDSYKLYFACFESGDSGEFKLKEAGEKDKTIFDLFKEAKDKNLYFDGVNQGVFLALLKIWNTTQSGDSNLQWHYSDKEISDGEIKHKLSELNKKLKA